MFDDNSSRHRYLNLPATFSFRKNFLSKKITKYRQNRYIPNLIGYKYLGKQNL